MPDVVTVQAAAKVNLTLHIVGKREDDFHRLESLMGFTDVTDHLTLTASEDVGLTVLGPEAGTLTGTSADEKNNLAVKAARLAQEFSKTDQGVHVSLEKHIPVAAGMGGGSADAAAVVRGCMALWNTAMPDDLNHAALAAELGADVPVCHVGRAAWVSGIGESIAPAPAFPDLWMVLINPRIAVPTARVFQAFTGGHRTTEFEDGVGPAWDESVRDFVDYLSARANDLTAPAQTVAPVVGDVLNTLHSTGGCRLARMSGSGPTCFGLFAAEAEATSAAAAISGSRPDWWVRATPMLSIAPA